MNEYSEYTDKEMLKMIELAMHEDIAMCQFMGERANLMLECLHRLMKDKCMGIKSRRYTSEEIDS